MCLVCPFIGILGNGAAGIEIGYLVYLVDKLSRGLGSFTLPEYYRVMTCGLLFLIGCSRVNRLCRNGLYYA